MGEVRTAQAQGRALAGGTGCLRSALLILLRAMLHRLGIGDCGTLLDFLRSEWTGT